VGLLFSFLPDWEVIFMFNVQTFHDGDGITVAASFGFGTAEPATVDDVREFSGRSSLPKLARVFLRESFSRALEPVAITGKLSDLTKPVEVSS